MKHSYLFLVAFLLLVKSHAQAQLPLRIDRITASLPKNYTIPLVDLSGQSERHVVIDRDSTRYFGHPSTLLMPDGKTMYCAYSIDHGGAPLYLRKSVDGGLTWSGLLPVPANAKDLRNCPFIFYQADSKGRDRLLMMVGSGDSKGDGMWQVSSYDGGLSWTDYTDNGRKSVVASPTMLTTRDREKQIIWHHNYAEDGRRAGKGKALDVFQSESTDGGETWGNTHVISAIEDASPCEPAVVASPDGKTWVCLMRENSRRLNSVAAISKDEGVTWSPSFELPAALTGDRHQPIYTKDKKHLIIAFRDMAEHSPTKGDFVLWVGTFNDLINGREGICRVKLLHQYGPAKWDCGYSGLERLPNGTFVATTYVRYKEEDKKNSIISVRFRMEEILQQIAK